MRSPNLYSRKENAKIEIKYLFLERSMSGKSNLTNIGILTVDGKYIEYEIKIIQKNITKYVAQRIRQLFFPYKLTRNSSVIISDTYDENEPLYMYLRFIRQHLQFNLNVVDVDQIVSRISHWHKQVFSKSKKKINKYFLNRLWDWLVKQKRCMWINQAYDMKLKMMSQNKAREKKILRLGIYYMIVKQHIIDINERSRIKNLQKQNNMIQNSIINNEY